MPKVDAADIRNGRGTTWTIRDGQDVMVSTRPAWNDRRFARDSTSLWGFDSNEWRRATVSEVFQWTGRVSISVQFESHGCHWGFSEDEILPLGAKLPSRF